MNNVMPAILPAERKVLCSIRLVFFLLTLLVPGEALYADNLDDCLLKALKSAEDSVTVGQLREQCGKVASANTDGEDTPPSLPFEGPEEMILKTQEAKKPAVFPHGRHQGRYTCGKCHHGKNKQGRLKKYTSETDIEKCMNCHNSTMRNKELNSYQEIGHALCRECHRKNQDITSAKCYTCHPKNL